MACSGNRPPSLPRSGEGGLSPTGESRVGGKRHAGSPGDLEALIPDTAPSTHPARDCSRESPSPLRGREVRDRAREMRSALTPQEARLWACLKALRSEGFRFRRQAPFRGYFLDFVCFKSGLVVEADGSGHFNEDQAEHDRVRDKVLKRASFDTLQVSNADINTNIEGVIAAVLEALNPIPPSPEVGRADSRRPAASRVGGWCEAGDLDDFEATVPETTPSPHPALACRRESALPTSGEGGG